MQARCILRFAAVVLINMGLALAENPTLFVQQGPRNPSNLCVNKEGTVAATADSDGVRVYDLSNRRQVRTLQHFAVRSVALSPDGSILASAGQDEPADVGSGTIHHSVKLWRLSNGELIRSLNAESLTTNLSAEFYSVAFSPNGKLMAASAIDNTLRIWNTDDYGAPKLIKLQSSLLSISFSPDSRTVAGGGYHHLLGTWRVDDGQPTSMSTSDSGDTNVSVVAYSPDGTTLASAGADRKVTLWNVASRKIDRVMIASTSVMALDFSPDGHTLISTDGASAALWNVQPTCLTSENVPLIGKLRDPDDTTLSALHFIGNDRFVAADLYQNRLQLWRLGEDKPLWTITASADGINCLRLELDGKVLVSEGAAGAKLWDYQKGELRSASSKHFICPVGASGLASPDLGISASIGMSNIPISSMADGHLVQTLESKDGADSSFTTALAFSRDGKFLASGTVGGFVRLWDLAKGVPILTRNVNPPPKYLNSFGTTRVQDPATMFPAVVSSLALNAEKTILAGEANNGGEVGKIRFWNLSDGKELDSLWDLHDFVTALSFDATGRVFAAGFATGNIVVWDMSTRTVRLRLSGHTGRISSLLFDSTKSLLISGASDGQVKMWNLTSGKEVLTLISPNGMDWLAVAPNGLFDGTPTAMKNIGWRIDNTNEVASMEAFYNDFFAPGLFTEVLQGKSPSAVVDITTALQLPGLKTMLALGDARFLMRNGKEVLCLRDAPTANFTILIDAQPTAFDASQIVKFPNDPECPAQYVVDSSKQVEFIPAKRATIAAIPHFSYDHEKSETAGATLHIATFAISAYDSKRSGFPPLPSLIRQAQQFADVFSAAEKAKALPYKSLKVWEGLYNSSATTAGILSQLGDIADAVKPEDVVVLLFSGHGTIPAGQEMFYFVTSDTRGPDPMTERDSGLSTAMLVEALRAIPARRVVLIIDSCQSGGALEALSKVVQVKAVDSTKFAQEPHKEDGANQRIGLDLIAAASPLDEAIQPSVGNDALIGAILASLERSAVSPAGTIWISDVVKAIDAANGRSRSGKSRTSFMTVSSGLDFPLIGGSAVSNRP